MDEKKFRGHYNLASIAGGEWQQALALLAAMESLEVPWLGLNGRRVSE